MPSDWSSDLGARIHPLNTAAIRREGAAYVLAWTQQTLRARDNPLLDAAIDLGNRLGLPVLVYHGLQQGYPHASDRLHRFILGASREFQRDCHARGLACVTHVDRPGRVEKGLVYRLAERAAAVLTDDHYVFVARAQAARVAARLDLAVLAVDTARLVPSRRLPEGLKTTPAFRKASGALRAEYEAAPRDLAPACPPYDGPVCFEETRLAQHDDAALDALVASCAIDHTLPPVTEFAPSRQEALRRLDRFVAEDLPRYPWRRNNPADASGVSTLSPYLHFGLIGPREITAAVRGADTYAKSKWKYLDELLTWREYFHYKALHDPDLHRFESLPDRPRESLLAHADDPRPVLHDLDTLIHGRTEDETWNAAQRQWLNTGYMHNNLRMYWGKRMIGWTAHPAIAWRVACDLNDRLSLDGRDPATYGNMQWVFGAAKPGWREQPVYGWVAPKSDAALRKRAGFAAWAAEWATRAGPQVSVPPDGLEALR